MSNTQLGNILGINPFSSQEEVDRALARADQEISTLQQESQRSAAQDRRLRNLQDAVNHLNREYGGRTYASSQNPPDTALPSSPSSQDYDSRVQGEHIRQEPRQIQQVPPQTSYTSPVDPTAAINAHNQPRADDRPILICPYTTCTYQTIHQGHFSRHVAIHRRG